MKILFVFFILSSQLAIAQVRHVKGIKSLEIGGGTTRYSKIGYLGYVTYMNSKFNMKFDGFYGVGSHAGLKYNSIGVEISGAYSVLTIGESFYINLRGGLLASSDKLNPSITVYDNAGNPSSKNYSTIKLGALGGIEGESFITDKIVFILGWNQRILSASDFGKTRWFGYGGIRYNF